MENVMIKKMTARVALPLLLLAGAGIISFQVFGEPDVIEIHTCQDLQNIQNMSD